MGPKFSVGKASIMLQNISFCNIISSRILDTLIEVYGLNIYQNHSMVLAAALRSGEISVTTYLLKLGCYLSGCIHAHHQLFKGTAGISPEHIEYFMAKNFDISWLYTLPKTSSLHFTQYIDDDATKTGPFIGHIILHLGLNGYHLDLDSVKTLAAKKHKIRVNEVISYDWVDLFSNILQIYPDTDRKECIVMAKAAHAEKILKMLSGSQ
jgi:hypothetical protein